MANVLIVGAGGVGQVVTHKCAQVPEVFSQITLADRTLDKCERIAAQIKRPINTVRVKLWNKRISRKDRRKAIIDVDGTVAPTTGCNGQVKTDTDLSNFPKLFFLVLHGSSVSQR